MSSKKEQNIKKATAKPVAKKSVSGKASTVKKAVVKTATKKPVVSKKALPKAKATPKKVAPSSPKKKAPVKVTPKKVVPAKKVASTKGVVPASKNQKAKEPSTKRATAVLSKKTQTTLPKPSKKSVALPSKATKVTPKKPLMKGIPLLKSKAPKELLPLPSSLLPPPLPPPPPVRIKSIAGTQQKLSDHDLRMIRNSMIQERARLTGNVSELREQSLVRHDEVNHEEDGTDAFIRLQDLDRASSDQETIAKIDTALRAIDDGSYGLCERCSNKIESPRLRALPFVKTCIKCQSETEGGHRGKISVRHLLWD